MKSHQIKLKPCPKCGSNKVKVKKHLQNYYFGLCISCNYLGPIFHNPINLKKRWNEKSKRRSILFRKF